MSTEIQTEALRHSLSHHPIFLLIFSVSTYFTVSLNESLNIILAVERSYSTATNSCGHFLQLHFHPFRSCSVYVYKNVCRNLPIPSSATLRLAKWAVVCECFGNNRWKFYGEYGKHA